MSAVHTETIGPFLRGQLAEAEQELRRRRDELVKRFNPAGGWGYQHFCQAIETPDGTKFEYKVYGVE